MIYKAYPFVFSLFVTSTAYAIEVDCEKYDPKTGKQIYVFECMKFDLPPKPKTRGRRGPALNHGAPPPTMAPGYEFGPDGKLRKIIKSGSPSIPKPIDKQPSSSQQQESLKGKAANGCVTFLMNSIITFSNSCDKNVMIQFAKFCHISDPNSGTAGKTEVRALYFYPREIKNQREIDLFGSFCQVLAGNTSQYSIKSQTYQ